MDNQTDTKLKHIVEGLIFAADEPLTHKQIRELIEGESTNGSPNSAGLTPQKIQLLIDELNDDYERQSRPYHIQAIAGGFIFATNRDVSLYVGKLHREQSKKRLTQAALETLSIIAYKQPITKVVLETIRGVNSDYIVKSLLEKDLITIVGREPTVGRPLLYGTTNRFLMHFGLNSINELPKPREIDELIGETELEVEKRLMDLEKQKQEVDDKSAQKRERKPHPLSEGATAKIIPLKPDYRPVKKKEPEFEEEPDADTTPGTKEVERREIPEQVPVQEEIDEPQAQEEKEDHVEPEQPETTGEPVEQIDRQEESETIEEPEEELDREQMVREDSTEEMHIEQEEQEPRRGWKHWKNKIVKIVKKIFG